MFYLFFSFIFFCSIKVITVSNPVYSVFYLILCFCNASFLMFMIENDFLGIVYIIVYVGAIAILFLFVIIILKVERTSVISNFYYVVNSLYFVPTFFFFFFFSFNITSNISSFHFFSWVHIIEFLPVVEKFSQVLYVFYFFPLFIVGLILLLAIIVAVVIGNKPKSEYSFTNNQQLPFQVSRNLYSNPIVFIA